MVNFVLVLLGGFSLVLLISATILAYKIYKFNRLSPWWLVLLSAFELEVLRQMLGIFTEINLDAVSFEVLVSRVLLFVISLLLNIGLWSMLKNFEKFEFIKEKVGKKAREFKK